MGGGDNIVSLGLGGLTNFTKAIFEVRGDTISRKKFALYARFFPILQYFRHLINYVALCKFYTTVLSLIVY